MAKSEQVDILEKTIRMDEIEKNLEIWHVKMAEFLAEGYSQYRSIQLAKPSQKYKSLHTATASACKLLKSRPDILEYAELLRQVASVRASNRLFAAAIDKRETLWEVVERGMKKGRGQYLPRAVISAITELNRMDGDHAAVETKVEQTSVNRNVDFEAVSPQEASTAYQDMIKQGQEDN